MADFYPLIFRGVAALQRNTGEARRALYERARTVLVAQLRGVQPPLSEEDITRERITLEDAIRKVEREQTQRPKLSTKPEATQARLEALLSQLSEQERSGRLGQIDEAAVRPGKTESAG